MISYEFRLLPTFKQASRTQLLLSYCISSLFCFPQAQVSTLKLDRNLQNFDQCVTFLTQLNPSSIILTLVHKLFEKRIIEIAENSPSYFLVIARSIEHSWVLLFEERATLNRTIGLKCFQWQVAVLIYLIVVFSTQLWFLSIFLQQQPPSVGKNPSTLNNTQYYKIIT